MSSTFHVRINDGPVHTITTRTGLYQHAAVAALAMFDFEDGDEPAVVEIWVPEFLPEYGPYFYRMDDDGYGNLVVRSVVKVRECVPSGSPVPKNGTSDEQDA